MPQTSNKKLKFEFPQTRIAKNLIKDQKDLLLLLQKTWESHQAEDAEVEINFVDKPTICELHESYLNDNTPTDIITFDLGITPDKHRCAALYICSEVAEQHAEKFKTTLDKEIHRLIIHGILHLLGLDDKDSTERRRMRYHENKLLKLLHPEKIL